MFDINFFTCCNNEYCNFIPLFIFSNLYNIPNSHVEIGYDNWDVLNDESINILKEMYPNRFLLRNVKFNPITIKDKKFNSIPNTIRFITEPLVKTKYVYISDIDILTLDKNILNIHLKNMENHNLKYSNIVRPRHGNFASLKRLSGLHFTPYENYYPIPEYLDLCELGYLNHDEAFLYEIVKKRYSDFNEDLTFRPVHGIHISPNREPNGKMNWGMDKWKNEWLVLRETPEFLKIEKYFLEYLKNKIKIIDNYYK